MTTVGATGYSSAQPRQYDPSAITGPAPVRVWLTTGNTDVVYDQTCSPNCFIDISPTVLSTGFWKIVATTGSFTVTSSDSESAGLTYAYRIRS